MNTKAYSDYRTTNVPSLNLIPRHWEIRNLGQMGNFSRGSGGNKEEELADGLPCIRYGDIYTEYKFHAQHTRSYIAPDRVQQYIPLHYGDALFAGSGETIEDIGKSVVNVMTEEAYCGGDVILFRPTVNVDPRYLGYLLDCAPVAHQKSCMGRGITIMHIYSSHLKYLPVPLPPPDEQATIVRYLDHADDLINRYISAKDRLIALLEEQREAIVHQAVTQGLFREVRFKPSDIEWLGDIPEHWEPRALKTICRMKSGDGITAESIEETSDYPVYGGNGVRGYTRNFTHDGEFVLIGRQGALCGNVHVAQGRFWASEHAVVASLAPSYDLNWFVGLLTSMNLNQYSIAAAQPGLSVERVMNLRVAVPPLAEQAAIGNSIVQTFEGANVATDQIVRQIDLINEYRTRLIADVVTGQLDVRDAAIRIPD